jgi:hypothetical protein
MSTTNELEVTVRDQGGFEMQLAVPESANVSQLLEVVQQEAPDHFPKVDQQGRLVHYAVEDTRIGTYLQPDTTFGKAGVQSGDVLELHPKPIAM